MNKKILIISILVVLFVLNNKASAASVDKGLEAGFLIIGLNKTIEKIDNIEYQTYTDFDINLVNLDLDKNVYLTKEINNTELKNPFKLNILDFNGNKTYEISFSANFLLPHSSILTNATYIPLTLPYSENSKYLKIYYKNKELLSADIQSLLCNHNGSCSGFENYLSCPQDCSPSGEDYYCNKAEDNICDPDCSFGDPDCYSYPIVTKFSPNLTTDFSKIKKQYLDYLKNVKLGIEGKGQIDFKKSHIDVNGADLDLYVIIEKGKISINVQNLPNLNKSATLTFFGVTGNILKNNQPCPDCESEIKDGNLVVKIKDFDGAYTVSKVPLLQPRISDEFPVGLIVSVVIILLFIFGLVFYKLKK